MKLKVKNLHISTGGTQIVLVYFEDAIELGLKHGDRVVVRTSNKKKEVTAIVDITNASDIIYKGQIGLFAEVGTTLKVKTGTNVNLEVAKNPRSVYYISKKLRGARLNEAEMLEIVKDVTDNRLTDIEKTYFVSACYMHELNMDETVSLTNAMIKTGETLKFGKGKIIADKHCIGGVAGNRTTCFVVPIIAAAGITIPKTSSRSITSPAGTADTMEVLCKVTLSLDEMKKVIKKVGACMVWGGSMDLAPADDKIIKVEHPMSLDPVGQLLASILAKKKSAGSTHCLIDIPLGKGAKLEDESKAVMLKTKFEQLGKKLDMKVKVMITDGSEPIGNGIGPSLEARDLLWTLSNDPRGSTHLLEKGIHLAGQLLELVGKSKKGTGRLLAKDLVESGAAAKKFAEILEHQGAKITDPKKIKLGSQKVDVLAPKTGVVSHVDNQIISRIAKLAGAPSHIAAGLYLHRHKGELVEKGSVLYTIYAKTKSKLEDALSYSKTALGFEIKKGKI